MVAFFVILKENQEFLLLKNNYFKTKDFLNISLLYPGHDSTEYPVPNKKCSPGCFRFFATLTFLATLLVPSNQ